MRLEISYDESKLLEDAIEEKLKTLEYESKDWCLVTSLVVQVGLLNTKYQMNQEYGKMFEI